MLRISQMGSPLLIAVLFGCLALWIVLLALPGLRRPPPGFERKLCPACNKLNSYDQSKCIGCGAPLPPPVA